MQKVAFRVVKSYFLLEGLALLQVAEDAAVATGHWFAMLATSQARAGIISTRGSAATLTQLPCILVCVRGTVPWQPKRNNPIAYYNGIFCDV